MQKQPGWVYKLSVDSKAQWVIIAFLAICVVIESQFRVDVQKTLRNKINYVEEEMEDARSEFALKKEIMPSCYVGRK